MEKTNADVNLNIQIESPNPIFTITFTNETQEELFEGMRLAIEQGCQCWIMDAIVSDYFFQIFDELLHKFTLQRPIRTKILLYNSSSINERDILNIFDKSIKSSES